MPFVVVLVSVLEAFDIIRSGKDSLFSFLAILGLSLGIYFLNYQININPELVKDIPLLFLVSGKSIIILTPLLWITTAAIFNFLKKEEYIYEDDFLYKFVYTGIVMFCGCMLATGLIYASIFHMGKEDELFLRIVCPIGGVLLYCYLLVAWDYIAYKKSEN